MTKVGQNNVALVTGRQCVDPQVLTPSEWHEIILSATQALTVKSLQGLVTLKSILEERRNGAVCKAGSDTKINHLLLERFPQANLLFIDTRRPLPSWENWPRASEKVWHFASAEESFVVLRRSQHGSSHFVDLKVTWALEEKWDDTRMVPSLIERRLTAINILAADRIQIDYLFECLGPEASQLGYQILYRLCQAQRETANALSRRAENAVEAANRLEGYLSRLQKA